MKGKQKNELKRQNTFFQKLLCNHMNEIVGYKIAKNIFELCILGT